MFSNGSSPATVPDNDSSQDIPEWKKILIMKKRAGVEDRRSHDTSPAVNMSARNGHCDTVNGVDFREISPPKKVTIGNINVELRSVKSEGPGSNPASGPDGQDLQYGPGIVDRLRARFLNMGNTKQEVKSVVRRFSSLENLPGSQAGPYRVNARGSRPFGTRPGSAHVVKKAQSMETLVGATTPEQQIFASSRRPNARYVGGVKGRILKNIGPISVLPDENDEPDDVETSPRLFAKSVRRWDYSRSVSAPNINEDELPKPDTVKHVKKIFESPPPPTSCSEKPAVPCRFRRVPGTEAPRPAVKKPADIDSPDAKVVSAKVSEDAFADRPLPLSPVEIAGDWGSDYDLLPPLDRARDAADINAEGARLESSENSQDLIESRVTLEQSSESNKHQEPLSQGSPIAEVEQFENQLQSPGSCDSDSGMVVAATGSEGELSPDTFPGSSKKNSGWQKAPPPTTSIVFDFRGKDVKPNISLNPAPFGCRPAKVSRGRSGSPPRNGIEPADGAPSPHEVNGRDDDWDEMDIGADLPAVSGIVFAGENVKVGRGSLLEKRNKKLSIQFDDRATSTFEYPSETTSPSPSQENGSPEDLSFDSTVAMGSISNSRLGLSYYTPQVLSSNIDFELGISQSNHKPTSLGEKSPQVEEVPAVDVIIPANPNDTGGWSATETADILF